MAKRDTHQSIQQRSHKDQRSANRCIAIPNVHFIPRHTENVFHSSHHQSRLTDGYESNHCAPHDNQSSISFNLCLILVRDVTSRKLFSCGPYSTSNVNLGSRWKKVDNFRTRQLLGSFVNRQGRLFSSRSPSRPLSRRVAHHPELRPCSLLSAHSARSASSSANGRHPAN
jgi:hypothetical protein